MNRPHRHGSASLSGKGVPQGEQEGAGGGRVVRRRPDSLRALVSATRGAVRAQAAQATGASADPRPQTPNPDPQTTDPRPQTPDPRPQTPDPKPQTPDPKPPTPNPKPQVHPPTPWNPKLVEPVFIGDELAPFEQAPDKVRASVMLQGHLAHKKTPTP